MKSGTDLLRLSFVEKKKEKDGLNFYSNKNGSCAVTSGKKNAIELMEFYKGNVCDKEIFSRMLVSLIDIDPVNQTLTKKEESIVGHIKGLCSVMDYHAKRGLLLAN